MTALSWDKGGCGYLFSCVQQRGGLSSACLLDHLVKKPILVLEQHIWLVILPDPASIQDLQSHIQCWVCVCLTPSVYFTLEKTDTSAVSLLSDACRRCKMNGETVVLCASEPSILRDSCNSKHQCLFLLDRATDNERNLLAV